MTNKIYKQGSINICIFLAIAIFLTAIFHGKSEAKQTVFNAPTADVLGRGNVSVELDAGFKANNQDALRNFSSFVPRVDVGAGGNVEIRMNVTGNLNPGTDTMTFVPSVKWKFYQNKKKGVSLFAGSNLYFPARNRSYKLGTYSYLAVAKTINKTRVTTGGFVFSKSVVSPNAVRGGGQFAIEQTINSKLTLAADWLTGKRANGYFTPGVFYKPHPKVTTYFAYSIGNADANKGNHFFLVELGYNF